MPPPGSVRQALHSTSVRTIHRVRSVSSTTFSGSTGWWKLGQPVPESNLVSESNSGVPQQMHL